MSASPFQGVLSMLIRQRGVLGCLVVGEADGIIVDSNVQVGIQSNVVAALAAALYRKARLCSAAAGLEHDRLPAARGGARPHFARSAARGSCW